MIEEGEERAGDSEKTVRAKINWVRKITSSGEIQTMQRPQEGLAKYCLSCGIEVASHQGKEHSFILIK